MTTLAPSTPAPTPTHASQRVTVQIPRAAALLPPVTARRVLRWTLVWATAAALAFVAQLADAPAWVRVLTAGLPAPGGAYFATGAPVAGALIVGVVGVAIFCWWAFGPAVLPPMVWLGAAIAAAITQDAPPTSTALALTACAPLAAGLVLLCVHLLRAAGQRRRGLARNAQLAARPVTITGAPSLQHAAAAAESTPDDLAHLRHALDMALQPVDEFAGFLVYDQYREAALRYQCYMLGYALSMARATRTPAFAGYLAEAQRGAIERVGDRRVWGYWASENAWGRLRTNRDPVNVPGNIMLTGYHGVQVGMYEAFGDDRYSRPGGLTYRWNASEAYANTFSSITQSVRDNMISAEYTLFPCEPNWIYTVCNAFGLAAITSHDAVRGTDWLAEIEPKVRASYETEFLRPDGRLIGMRSNHCGLTWNFWTGEAVQLTSAFWLHPSLPDLAHRHWLLLREQVQRDADGRPSLPRSMSGRLDPGNYRYGGEGYSRTILALTAQELGDTELADAALRAVHEDEPIEEHEGARRYRDLSPYTNFANLVGRFGRPSALRDLVAFGMPEAIRTGPRLAEADYPEILVARATTDGSALELVLRPGRGACRSTLVLDQLAPGRRYAVDGALTPSITADAEGRATLSVELDDRLAVRVAPAA